MTGEASGTAYEIGAPRPEWMARVAAFDARGHEWFERFSPPPGTTKRSAVLMLFAPSVDGRAGESVVLTERAHTLRSHPGQVSFPGGASMPPTTVRWVRPCGRPRRRWGSLRRPSTS